ncbi:hypothetical protein [Nitrospirillum amazonense]|uniref:hypothetical protein n=1 Tax=Nitrospirillum amazonense TaxID=28077 RepID=UPI002412E71A|nr:hypothetical protein [Nitrospirillum amazonense]MDG3444664.1 hypothetical protein [Nitrospirillum amazonense]
MAEYSVVLLDKNEFEIASCLINGLPNAKKQARYLLSDAYAVAVETTHDDLGTHKVEIRDAAGECLFDAFRLSPANAAA